MATKSVSPDWQIKEMIHIERVVYKANLLSLEEKDKKVGNGISN